MKSSYSRNFILISFNFEIAQIKIKLLNLKALIYEWQHFNCFLRKLSFVQNLSWIFQTKNKKAHLTIDIRLYRFIKKKLEKVNTFRKKYRKKSSSLVIMYLPWKMSCFKLIYSTLMNTKYISETIEICY